MNKILLLLGAVLTIQSAQAATINWASGGGRGHMFVLGDGSRVPAGSLLRVGYFETAGDTNSTFNEFGRTTLSAVGDQTGGHILSTQSTTSTATTFNGRQLYIWVYNAPTEAAATQSQVFTSVEWTTPGNFNTPDATWPLVLGVSAAGTPPAVVALASPGDSAPGSFTVGPITVSGGTQANGSIYNLGIPEPSAALMGALAGLGLLVRRRR